MYANCSTDYPSKKKQSFSLIAIRQICTQTKNRNRNLKSNLCIKLILITLFFVLLLCNNSYANGSPLPWRVRNLTIKRLRINKNQASLVTDSLPLSLVRSTKTKSSSQQNRHAPSGLSITPAGVSGAAIWFRADVGTGASVDGDPVNTWADQSGNLRDAGSSNPPLYATINAINYNPAVYYEPYTTERHVLFTKDVHVRNSTMYIVGIPVSSPYDAETWTVSTPSTGNGSDGLLFLPSGTNIVSYYDDPGGNIDGTTLTWMPMEPAMFRTEFSNAANYNAAYSKAGAVPYVITNANANLNDDDYYWHLGNYGDDTYPDAFGYIAETIVFSSSPQPEADKQKIESYLALKYGISLDNSSGATGSGTGTEGNYVLSDGSTVWNASVNPAYQQQVTGIARDNASALLQKQSHTADDSLRIYVDGLATDNPSNPGVIANDLSSIVTGNNGGNLMGLISSHQPTGIYSIFDRHWKVTNSNFTDNFSLQITWNNVGNVNQGDIRLLVSGSSDFSLAHIYTGSDIGIAVDNSQGLITLSGISNSIINKNSTAYITIASASSLTPLFTSLPISLIAFNASAVDNNEVDVSWETTFELNNNYFTVEKSSDGNSFETVSIVNSAGNSSSLEYYHIVDKDPYNGTSYYRLKQTDLDGKFTYSVIKTVKIDKEKSNTVSLYPNPASRQLTIKGNAAELRTVKLYDIEGQDVSNMIKLIESNGVMMVLDISKLPAGTYTVKTTSATNKIIKQ